MPQPLFPCPYSSRPACSVFDDTNSSGLQRLYHPKDMSTTATGALASSERDLTVHQKSLADNCFDEGQYEAAIDALDQIRSRKNKPYE